MSGVAPTAARTLPTLARNAASSPGGGRRPLGGRKPFDRTAVTWKFYHVLLLFAHYITLFHMALRECRVTFRDVRDIDHSVTVLAETSMDAAALGLKRIRGAAVRDGRSDRPGNRRAGHLHAAQSVAQESDGVDVARGRGKSQGNGDEDAGAGGVIPRSGRRLYCTFPAPGFISIMASQFAQRAIRIELNPGSVFSKRDAATNSDSHEKNLSGWHPYRRIS
jgi:hypothetical protein